MNKYPSIVDLQKKAHTRIPFVAKEYLETGTGQDHCLKRNTEAFQKIALNPSFLHGELNPILNTNVLGQSFNLPFGIAPIGLTGLMWPKAELYLAQSATEHNMPYCLSTVATRTPEELAPFIDDNGWYQLYTPRKEELTWSMLDSARDAGFKNLVITIDIPAPSKRERTKRAGMQMPPKLNPRFLWQAFKRPAWSWQTLKNGLPRLKTIESYSEFKSMMSVGAYVQNNIGGNLSWEYANKIKEYWQGPVILKGILNPKDAELAVKYGYDGIVVSNHGGRQFDGAPGTLDILPEIVSVVDSKCAILFDGGIRSGLDIAKALIMGADFALLGRAFMYSVCALGPLGPSHAINILAEELSNAMIQLGISDIHSLKSSKSQTIV